MIKFTVTRLANKLYIIWIYNVHTHFCQQFALKHTFVQVTLLIANYKFKLLPSSKWLLIFFPPHIIQLYILRYLHNPYFPSLRPPSTLTNMGSHVCTIQSNFRLKKIDLTVVNTRFQLIQEYQEYSSPKNLELKFKDFR